MVTEMQSPAVASRPGAHLVPRGHRAALDVTPRALVPLAVSSLLVYVALAMLSAHPPIQALDQVARAWIQLLRHEAVFVAMGAVTTLGDHRGLVPLIVLTSLVLWRADRPWALALPVIMAGTGLLQWIAKWVADRPRPDTTPWGFPSGHVLSLVVLFGLIAYLVHRAAEGRGPRALAIGAAAAIVLVVAFSRLYLDRHWLSDVVGGAAIGAAYVLLVIWLVELVRRRRAAGAPASPIL
jgi:undecaprenyl-diphosphatase